MNVQDIKSGMKFRMVIDGQLMPRKNIQVRLLIEKTIMYT